MGRLTPEALVYDLKRARDPQVSPNGERIVYSLAVADRATRKDTSHLWLCDVDGGNARQLTQAGDSNGGARWSPDGRQIAFTSSGADRGEGTGLFVLPVDEPGEPREVTRHQQGLDELAWSPDGTRIAYVTEFDPENPDEVEPPEDVAPKPRVTRRVDYKRDGRGWLGDKRDHVWVVEVESGTRRRLTTALAEHGSPQWSPDGRKLVVGRADWATSSSQMLLIDAETGEETVIGPDLNEPEGGHAGPWAWSPSGDRLIFAGEMRWTAQPDLFIYEVASGQVRRLTDDLAVLPAGPFVWLDERQVLMHAFRAGASGLHVVDSESGGIEQVQSWQAMHSGLSVDRAGRIVVQARASLEDVGEIVVYDTQSGSSTVITSYNTALFADAPLATWERIEVQQGDLPIEGWLFLPPDFDASKRYPVVLSVHGGPESFYGYSFHPLQQLLAANGFLVVAANPRGSTSYGRDFADRVLGDWGDQPLKDLLAVLDELLGRPYADAARVGITGGSYGGYMTAWAIGTTQRFRASVCVAVTFDLESQYLGADFDHAYGDYAWGGPPWQNRAWYDAQSPSSFAHQTHAATLIVHGEEDHRCPIGQAEQMFVALKKAGCEAEFVRYPGGSHGVTSSGPPAHREDFLQRALAWFSEHLGGPEG